MRARSQASRMVVAPIFTVSFIISLIASCGVYYVFVEILQGTLPGFPAWLGG